MSGVALAVPASLAGIALAAPANAALAPQAVKPATTAPIAATGVAAAAPVSLAQASSSVVVLRYGSTGYYVKVVQGRLHIAQDGSFGPKTLSAVKAFQGRKGLARDGSVGPATWRALGGFPGGGTGGGGSSTGSGSNARAASIAHKYLGIPYVYGGSSPRGFDCSGLTSYVFRQVGKSLPRSARAQQAAVRRVSSPQVGDLVFYGYPAHHVGIYVGGGQMIDAPKPGMRVNKRAVYQPQVSSYGRP
ncbi:hypothetical protein VV02_02640 [Luteipulveratus mongoliensis]|uniref:NlpC/P60 domain-containing protein n=1 Tax=Luteipulveratus mongoliensis TaxID=571913 RepID=A0A0K1JPE2_9MICO|nr:hypothetical protein VV02_02640 [Luteipulveratus mongoliensis]